MASAALPSTVNFTDPLKYLPDGVESVMMSIQPNGGSQSFGQNVQIEFNFPNRSGLYIDPKSIHIRYTANVGAVASQAVGVIGCPVYAPFSTLTERINSMTIASCNNYGVTCHRWINSNLNVADQYGQQSAFGYSATTTDVPQSLDGRTLPVNASATSYSVSAPLICSAIAGCDHLIPTSLLGQIQLVFTTDALSNFINYNPAGAGTGTFTSFSISNFEVCFLAIDMGAAVDAAVASAGQKIYLRTSAWASNGQPFANSAGQQTLQYVMRYASLDTAILGFYGPATARNAAFDALDVTNGSGSYQFQVANKAYPMTPFNTATNKAGVLQELRRAFGSIADWRNSCSINSTEFNTITSDTTNLIQPGKFYVPYSFKRVSSFNPYSEVALLSGVSTAQTGLNVVINCAAAPGSATTALMTVNYSMLLEIDTTTRSFVLIQ